jgi:hypothetical protein
MRQPHFLNPTEAPPAEVMAEMRKLADKARSDLMEIKLKASESMAQSRDLLAEADEVLNRR